jgi:hypothetical protein
MAITPGAAPSRIFSGWWGTPALGIIVFHGAFDLTGGYGAAFSVVGGR